MSPLLFWFVLVATCAPYSFPKKVKIIILEIGILIHSMIIGLKLGVSPDDLLGALFAISFYQIFDGIALGVLLQSAKLKSSTRLFMCIIYPLIAPYLSYGANSRTSIVVEEGILDSLVCGILIFDANCELVSSEIKNVSLFCMFTVPLTTLLLTLGVGRYDDPT